MMPTSATATAKPPMKRNLRHHLRVPVQMTTTLQTPQGDELMVRMANLSRQGMMLSCDQAALNLLHPRPGSLPQNPVTVQARFTLPGMRAGTVQIEALCGVSYVRRLSRDHFHVGLEFKYLDEQLVPHLEHYIETCRAEFHRDPESR